MKTNKVLLSAACMSLAFLLAGILLLPSYGPAWDCVLGDYAYGEQNLEFYLTGDLNRLSPPYPPVTGLREPHPESRFEFFWQQPYPFGATLSAPSCRVFWYWLNLLPAFQAHNFVILLFVELLLFSMALFFEQRIGITTDPRDHPSRPLSPFLPPLLQQSQGRPRNLPLRILGPHSPPGPYEAWKEVVDPFGTLLCPGNGPEGQYPFHSDKDPDLPCPGPCSIEREEGVILRIHEFPDPSSLEEMLDVWRREGRAKEVAGILLSWMLQDPRKRFLPVWTVLAEVSRNGLLESERRLEDILPGRLRPVGKDVLWLMTDSR